LEKKQEVFQLYKNGLKGLESIENQYIKSDLDNKRRLIGSIFPENFQFENKKVRTTDINPILDKIAQFNRVNRKNKKRDKSKKEDLSRCVHLKFLNSNSFIQGMAKINDFKKLLIYKGYWTGNRFNL
jgi:hypothetical protein